MPSWWSKVKERASVWGKRLRGGLESGIKLFEKAKAGYGQAKKYIADIPVIGGAASRGLGELEKKAIEKVGELTGGVVTPQNVQRAEGIARLAARNLPA
jgi:hypothetical protein